jgi:hypothetical protein
MLRQAWHDWMACLWTRRFPRALCLSKGGLCYPSNAGQKQWDYNILDDQGFSVTRFT